MQALLSRIRDVFDIEGRGCVIWPGIPLLSSIRVKIGDPIVIVQPDGTRIETQVRGIEMASGSSPDRSFIPILVDQSLQKADLPVGSEIHFNATTDSEFTYTIDGLSFSQFASDFLTVDDDKHLRFGWSAVSIHPAKPTDLQTIAYEFRDYVMEGFVSYLIRIQTHSALINFRVGLLGLNRDQYVKPQLDHCFSQAGIAARQGT